MALQKSAGVAAGFRQQEAKRQQHRRSGNDARTQRRSKTELAKARMTIVTTVGKNNAQNKNRTTTINHQVLSYKVKDSTNVEKDSDFQCYFQSLELTLLGWRATTYLDIWPWPIGRRVEYIVTLNIPVTVRTCQNPSGCIRRCVPQTHLNPAIAWYSDLWKKKFNVENAGKHRAHRPHASILLPTTLQTAGLPDTTNLFRGRWKEDN